MFSWSTSTSITSLPPLPPVSRGFRWLLGTRLSTSAEEKQPGPGPDRGQEDGAGRGGEPLLLREVLG